VQFTGIVVARSTGLAAGVSARYEGDAVIFDVDMGIELQARDVMR